jgi:hypothetical protein
LWACGALCLIYCAWLALRPIGVFWSLDEGGKYLYLQNVIHTGDARAPLEYPGRTVDPTLQFVPLYFWIREADQIFSWWPVGFPLLALPFYRSLGLAGLYVLPVAAGIASSYLAGVLVRQLAAPQRWLSPLAAFITGLATPVAFYSTLFWEHTLSVAGCVGAVACVLQALRTNRARWLAIAGVLGAAATFMRTEAGVLMAGLLLALLAWRWRAALRLGVIYAAACGPWLLLNLYWMGSPFSRYWSQLTGSGALEGAREAGLEFFPYLLFNAPRVIAFPVPAPWLAFGTLAVVMAVAGPLLGRWQWLGAAGSAGVALVSAYVLVQAFGYRSVHGLVVAAPQVVFAAWLGRSRSRNLESFFALAVLTITVLFGGVYLARGWLAAGGQQWGPRYLLALYPLYVVAGLVGLAQARPALTRRLRATLIGAFSVCLVLGVGYEIRGAAAVWQTVQTYSLAQAAIEALAAESVVTSCPYLVNVMPQLQASQLIFTIREPQQYAVWAEQARQAGVRTGYRVELDLCQPISLDEAAHLGAVHRAGITSEPLVLP